MSDPVAELVASVRLRRDWPKERRKKARIDADVSLRELATALDTGHANVRNWESAHGYNPRDRAKEAAYYSLLEKLELLTAETSEPS